MSLATFKKKATNYMSSATKRSGKPTNEYWLYPGPYGVKGNLPSDIFQLSLTGPNQSDQSDGYGNPVYGQASNAGFSINGSTRNIGRVGQDMKNSKSGTPYRGAYPIGWGGTYGRYPSGPNEVMLTIQPVATGVAIQNNIVKPSVLGTRGMLARRFRWIHSGQYPNYWVQPVYTGNQTDSASQGLYIHDKAAANDVWYDVNNQDLYVDYYRRGGSTGCQMTPARGYKMVVQQANGLYTKTLHIPKDSSAYTLYVQRRCQNPTGAQKPFPYAVQTGTGVLRGGINVTRVASACGTSNPVLTPPEWYTQS